MFAVDLILRAIKEGRYERAKDVVNWFSDFFEEDPYKRWLNVNGGWVCLKKLWFFIDDCYDCNTNFRQVPGCGLVLAGFQYTEI